jgi:hypothetical protein
MLLGTYLASTRPCVQTPVLSERGGRDRKKDGRKEEGRKEEKGRVGWFI